MMSHDIGGGGGGGGSHTHPVLTSMSSKGFEPEGSA